ncbi:MAG: nitroreductase family protein [Desulfovibrio sp.]|jgi:nitroreductase|nr:nitroreductase family protein [Desulfovibrio sp.]
MELGAVIKERRSIRKFTGQEVDHDLLEKLLRESLWAPSAMNRQPWKYIVLQGEALKKFLAFSAGVAEGMDEPLQKQNFDEKMRAFVKGYFRDLGGAPTVVVCLYKTGMEPVVEHGNLVSGAAAFYNFLLLAQEAGLATCWMTGYLYTGEALAALLGVEGYGLVGVTPVGYPAQTPPVPPRRHESIEWRTD